MAEFRSASEFREVMDRTFGLMSTDPEMGPKLRDARVPQRFEFPDQDAVVNVTYDDAGGEQNLRWEWSDDVDWEPKVAMTMSSEDRQPVLPGQGERAAGPGEAPHQELRRRQVRAEADPDHQAGVRALPRDGGARLSAPDGLSKAVPPTAAGEGPAQALFYTRLPMRAADALCEALKAEGVEHVFGIPGGANLPTYDALYDADLIHIQARHEQGAGHAAEGYAKASGRVGVAFATSGPGATNLVTAIADAMMDSVPTVFITGQVRTELIGTDGFQEADVTGITMPIVKHSFLVTDPRQIPAYIHQAFHIASTGRPGPVLVDVPQDLSRADIEYEPAAGSPDLPGYKPPTEGNIKQIRLAAKALANARRPGDLRRRRDRQRQRLARSSASSASRTGCR